MKPATFRLHMPSTLEEALDLLAEHPDDGKVLAGGQSLVPLLNMRLVAPSHVIDINGIPELAHVEVSATGVRVGALVRHAELEVHSAARRAIPLLAQALSLVAHPVIRNRGTTVGSLAHADPAGEMTAVLSLLGGEMELASKGTNRTVSADQFFVGPLETCIGPGELAVSARFPTLPPRTGTSFRELSRRHGDYAMCGVATAVSLDANGRVTHARASYISMSPKPIVLDLTDAIVGQLPTSTAWEKAARMAVDRLDPETDIHASAAYRRRLGVVLTRDALTEAAVAAAMDSAPAQQEAKP